MLCSSIFYPSFLLSFCLCLCVSVCLPASLFVRLCVCHSHSLSLSDPLTTNTFTILPSVLPTSNVHQATTHVTLRYQETTPGLTHKAPSAPETLTFNFTRSGRLVATTTDAMNQGKEGVWVREGGRERRGRVGLSTFGQPARPNQRGTPTTSSQRGSVRLELPL